MRGALAAAAEAAAPDPEQDDQLELLPATRFAGAEAEAVRDTVAEHHRARGRGRPPGAQNVVTRQLKELLLAQGLDPLQVIARWAMHTPVTLAKELGCTRLEAFDRLMALQRDLLPLFHARLAPVDGNGNAVVPTFQMIFGGAGEGGPSEAPWMADPEVRRRIVEHQQNQEVSDAANEKSHDEKSHGDAND